MNKQIKHICILRQSFSNEPNDIGKKIVRSFASRLKDEDIIDFDAFCRLIENDCDISRANLPDENLQSPLVRKNLRKLYVKISDRIKFFRDQSFKDMHWDKMCEWFINFDIPVIGSPS